MLVPVAVSKELKQADTRLDRIALYILDYIIHILKFSTALARRLTPYQRSSYTSHKTIPLKLNLHISNP